MVGEIKIGKYIYEYDQILLASLYFLSFVIPLIISKPQLLVGSAINFLIVFSTFRYGLKNTLPILIIPSLVATGNGLLFGSATLFLVYLMPFIMISNSILSLSVNKFKNIFGIGLGIILKVSFLYTATLILVEYIGLPKIFLTSMGYIQIYTAMIGGGLAYVLSIVNRKSL